jgi:hypothetical protein
MKLLLVRHLWGVDLTHGLGAHLGRWREVGYQAIEASRRTVPDAGELKRLLKSEGFQWIPQVFSNMFEGGGSVAAHLRTLQEQIEECVDAEPLFFNAHTGSDAWTLNEAEDFYGAVGDLETKLDVICSHETHRSRYFGNPWNTYRLIKRIPDIRLTADFSHWVCVAERLLADAAPLLSTIFPHCHHLHARVGYEEGPQVSDPRAPEWQGHLQVHERWWDAIWSAQRLAGASITTLTPEFGPPPYLQTLPFTAQPVADLTSICDWMAIRQLQRFASWSSDDLRKDEVPL